MTKEEAIAKLKNFAEHAYPNEEFLMAIEALEQEPCIQEKQANADKIDAVYIDGFKAGYSQARFDLEQERCEDAISRQAVLDAISRVGMCKCSTNEIEAVDDCSRVVEVLPSVTPAEKVGRWIEKDGYDGDTYYDCSECGESWTTIDGTPWNNGMKYCPNCGARMEVQ